MDTKDGTLPDTMAGWVAVATGIALIVIAGVAFFFLRGSVASDSITLSTIAALMLLAAALTGLIVAIKGLGALTPAEALALPSGSIRALLAFALVIAFIAVASWSLGEHGFRSGLVMTTEPFPASQLDTRLKEVTATYPAPRFMTIASAATDKDLEAAAKAREQAAAKVGAQTPAPPTQTAAQSGAAPVVEAAKNQPAVPQDASDFRKIQVYDQAGEQQFVDLQKQIVTTLATVLVAVVGFYFGGKSVSDAAATAASTVDTVRKALGGDGGDSAGGGNAPNQPQTPAALKGKAAQVAALADAAQGKLTALGLDPLKLLQQALAGSSDSTLQARLADAQKALSDLTTAAQATATDKSRALDAVQGLSDTETDAAKLSDLTTRLGQLLKDATAAGQAADAALEQFKTAQTAIVASTAKG